MAMAEETLPDDPATLKAMLVAKRFCSERLEQIIKVLQRHRFGRRAETLPEDQMLLGLEDVEQAEALAAAEMEDKLPGERAAAARKRRMNRGSLPAHLPRIEVVVDLDDKACPCCKGSLHRIGEDVSERLDILPARFRVLVTRRPKYACRACEEMVVQAPAPARLIAGGIPTEATVGHVLVSKYADHLPLYRQAQIFARQGIDLDRSTLSDWVGRAAWHLRPVHERLLAHIRASTKIFADETTAPCSIPAAGARKQGNCGPMPAMTALGEGLTLRPWPMFTRRTGRQSAPRPISTASMACFRSMDTLAIVPWLPRTACSSRSAGRTSVAAFTISPSRGLPRSPVKRFNASRLSTRSRRTYAAGKPTNGGPCGMKGQDP